jgi:hypothetical protein
MAGLVPAIFAAETLQDVDARDICAKTRFAPLPGHDNGESENLNASKRRRRGLGRGVVEIGGRLVHRHHHVNAAVMADAGKPRG